MSEDRPARQTTAMLHSVDRALSGDAGPAGAMAAFLHTTRAELRARTGELWLLREGGASRVGLVPGEEEAAVDETSRRLRIHREALEAPDAALRRAMTGAGACVTQAELSPGEGVGLHLDGVEGFFAVPLLACGEVIGVAAWVGARNTSRAARDRVALSTLALACRLAPGEVLDDDTAGILARVRSTEEDNARLQALTRELVQVEEQARARFARMLHDDLQQILVAASFALGTVHDEEHRGVRRTRDLLQRAIDRSRELSMEMSPPILEDGTLEDALLWLARRTTKLHGIEVRVQVDPTVRLIADDLRRTVFRLVQEALLNVRKHAGTERARVILQRARDGSVIAAVEDDGRGFETGSVTDGYGTRTLRQRLASLGGELHIQSRPGHGTRVEARLPASAVATPQAEDPQSGRSRSADGTVRVLIVDDHELIRSGLADMLSEADGFEVVSAAGSGKAALEDARDLELDAVLLDVNLPDLTGVEVARRLREVGPHLRIVGLSMHDDPAIAAAMVTAGADAFVSKGSPVAQIIAALR